MPSQDENSSPTGATIRSNVVNILDTTKTIIAVQYNGEYMVSANQPSNPPPTVTPVYNAGGLAYSIEFDAGREDTSDVADAFNTLCGGSSHQWCVGSFDSSPGDLNFYFGLVLYLKSEGNTSNVTVYVAQGSNWSNNWWIGGSCITAIPGLLTATIGGETVVLSIANFMFDSNGFTFTASNSSPQN